MDNPPLVGILMGSANDYEIMLEAARVLKDFGIVMEMTVASAHRSPQKTSRYAREASSRGLKVLIVGAGAAAHLAGVIAAETTLPVVAVPIDSSALKGLTPFSPPCRCRPASPSPPMAIGKAGARNAGILAAQILALGDASWPTGCAASRRNWPGIDNKASLVEERFRKDLG